MRRIVLLVCVVTVIAGALPAGARQKAAPYSVGRAEALAAVTCRVGDAVTEGAVPKDLSSGRAEPILLVHGTGVNAGLNYGWNYWDALAAEGFAECWIDLPDGALGDIQVSAEYAARALEEMYRVSKENVDVLGHSQGGLVPRWAIKYFAPGRFVVDDYIGLASPNHGTVVADSAVFACFESCWQMKTASNFIATLNSGDETPGATDYTSIYSATDELVQPVGTQDLDGGTNLLLQDLCPGRPVDHVNIAADYVTWELALSALTGKGGADPAALSTDACARASMPGASSPDPAYFPPEWGGGHFTSEEPPLKPYAS